MTVATLQEVGRAGRDGLPARADIFYNSYDISKSRKNMSDVMRDFGLTVVCETKWDETKWKSVVCEMEICSLRNENLQFAKWESVVCEMKICSLQNKNLYFSKWKFVVCEINITFPAASSRIFETENSPTKKPFRLARNV